MRKDCLERDLSAIMDEAARLDSGQNLIRIGGVSIPCEPGQPFGSTLPDLSGDWGDFSARVIVRTVDLPPHASEGVPCFYGGQKRRITGMERNVDGLTVELVLGGVRA